jgi:excisionase family DNA binding protein
MKRTNNWIPDGSMTPPATYVTVGQAAQYLQVCDMTVLRWIRSGKLPASKTSAGYRIAANDLETYLSKGRTAAA